MSQVIESYVSRYCWTQIPAQQDDNHPKDHCYRDLMRPGSAQAPGGRHRFAGGKWNTIARVAAVLVICHLLSVIIMSAQSTAPGGPLVLFPLASLWRQSHGSKQAGPFTDSERIWPCLDKIALSCKMWPQRCRPALVQKKLPKFSAAVQRPNGGWENCLISTEWAGRFLKSALIWYMHCPWPYLDVAIKIGWSLCLIAG